MYQKCFISLFGETFLLFYLLCFDKSIKLQKNSENVRIKVKKVCFDFSKIAGLHIGAANLELIEYKLSPESYLESNWRSTMELYRENSC